MSEIILNDEDRRLIEQNRLWAQMDMKPHWFGVGLLSFFPLGLVVIAAINGDVEGAFGLPAIWTYVVYISTRSGRRQIRMAKLVTKLAGMSALAEPTSGKIA